MPQTPLSMGFPRQEYWSGLPFPPPGDPPNPGMELASPVSPVSAGAVFTTEPPGKPQHARGTISGNYAYLQGTEAEINSGRWVGGNRKHVRCQAQDRVLLIDVGVPLVCP